jgi:hypothetical protein
MAIYGSPTQYLDAAVEKSCAAQQTAPIERRQGCCSMPDFIIEKTLTFP